MSLLRSLNDNINVTNKNYIYDFYSKTIQTSKFIPNYLFT